MMFLLQCPKCRNKMKYQSKGPISEKNRKSCVYCGRSYSIRDSIVKKIEG